MGQTKTLDFRPKEFNTLLSTLGLAMLWKGKEGDKLLIQCIAEPPVENAIIEFHKGRGCCDGSNPSECFKQRMIEAAKAKSKGRRPKQPNPREEFEGTD